jgi:hypothetical protein
MKHITFLGICFWIFVLALGRSDIKPAPVEPRFQPTPSRFWWPTNEDLRPASSAETARRDGSSSQDVRLPAGATTSASD